MPRLVLLLAVVMAAGLLANCSSGKDKAACDEPARERLDPNSAQHLVGDAEPPPYQSNPPTSGAHRVGRWPTGKLTAPIDPAVQVAMLEAGDVLVQYRGLSAADRARVEKLAGGDITVAPNPKLADPVVATAWTWKQTCRSVDTAAIRRFVDQHGGVGA